MPPFTNTNTSLLQKRLDRVVGQLRTLSFPTKEEYIAEIYNQVDRVIDTGYGMSKLIQVAAKTPAKIGDIETPITTLNNDGIDIINELNRVEDVIAQYFNMAAAAENELRQIIRNNMVTSSQTKFYEGFV